MDVFGNALLDYFKSGRAETLWLHNSYGEPEEMPVDIFFRRKSEMPQLERIALRNCRGRILDIGAGVGSHALALQRDGMNVTPIDISPAAVQIMLERKIKNARVADFFSFGDGTYDTLLLLMNGIGISGTLAGFQSFLGHARKLLTPGGQLLFDSSDISYLYDDTPGPATGYFGEISYQYEYRGQKGNWFSWLYLDKELLQSVSQAHGWKYELLFDDGEDQFLVRLTPLEA